MVQGACFAVLLQVAEHATVGPVRPSNRDAATVAESGLALLVAVFGVRVEVAVRRRVAALPEVADLGGDGGEHDEEVQRYVRSQLVEVAHPVDLRGEHSADLLRAARQRGGVPGHAGAVQDPVDGAETGADGVQRATHIVALGHVAHLVEHLGAGGFQLGEPGAAAVVERGASEQGEPGAAVFGEVTAEVGAECAGAAGDQVDAVFLQRRGVRDGEAGAAVVQAAFPAHAVGVAGLVPAAGGGSLGGSHLGEDVRGDRRRVSGGVDLHGIQPNGGVDSGHGPAEAVEGLTGQPGGAGLDRQARQQVHGVVAVEPVHRLEQRQQGEQLSAGILAVTGQRPQVDQHRRQAVALVQRPDQPVEVGGAVPVDAVGVRGRFGVSGAMLHVHEAAPVRRSQRRGGGFVAAEHHQRRGRRLR